MRNIRLQGRSVILTWLISYLTVLLLPIAISIVVYNESAKTLEAEINNANSSLLKQLKEFTDNQLNNMMRLSFEITWNVKVQELLYSNKYKISPNDYNYDLFQITQDLKMYKSSYSFIDEFYIYIASDQTVLFPGLVSNGKLAYQLYHQDENFTYDNWLKTMNRDNFHRFIPIVHIGEDGQKRKAVAYISSYPGENRNQPAGMNVTIIDQSRILGAVGNTQLINKGKLFILNQDNVNLVSNDRALPLDFPYSKLSQDSGVFYIYEAGQREEVVYIHSSLTGCKYVAIIPSRLFWEKSQKIRNLTYTSFLVSFIGGCFLTLFFVKKNYGPIRRLLQTLSDKSGATSRNDGNEFHYIEQTMGQTFLKMDKIMLSMKQHRHILRSNFITRLLKGKGDKQIPVDEALLTYDMKFVTDDFAVLLFIAEEPEHLTNSISEMNHLEKEKLLQYVIANVVEELAHQKHRGYVTEVDDAMACLINFSSLNEHLRADDLRSIAKEAQSFLHRAYQIHLTVSISGIHSSLSGINQAYMEALDALEYKMVIGSKEILTYDEIHRVSDVKPQSGYYYPLSVEQQLMNNVKIGDFETAKSTLDNIFMVNFSKSVLPPLFAKCLLFDLTSTLIKTIDEIGDPQETFMNVHSKAVEKLMTSATIQEIQLQLTDILTMLCSYNSSRRQTHIQQTRQRTLRELVKEVTAYVEKHYNDVNLNVSLIGELMDMKATYVSKLFKEQTGEGLLDYITKLRITKAKQAIAEHHMSIYEVAGRVGFSDVTSFIRTFKKYEGITPGKYKDFMSQSN